MMKTTNTWEDSVFGTESVAHETSSLSGLMNNMATRNQGIFNTSKDTSGQAIMGKNRRNNCNDRSIEGEEQEASMGFLLQDL